MRLRLSHARADALAHSFMVERLLQQLIFPMAVCQLLLLKWIRVSGITRSLLGSELCSRWDADPSPYCNSSIPQSQKESDEHWTVEHVPWNTSWHYYSVNNDVNDSFFLFCANSILRTYRFFWTYLQVLNLWASHTNVSYWDIYAKFYIVKRQADGENTHIHTFSRIYGAIQVWSLGVF